MRIIYLDDKKKPLREQKGYKALLKAWIKTSDPAIADARIAACEDKLRKKK